MKYWLYNYDVEERIAELGLELRIPGVPGQRLN